jgi:hypothetical protein
MTMPALFACARWPCHETDDERAKNTIGKTTEAPLDGIKLISLLVPGVCLRLIRDRVSDFSLCRLVREFLTHCILTVRVGRPVGRRKRKLEYVTRSRDPAQVDGV